MVHKSEEGRAEGETGRDLFLDLRDEVIRVPRQRLIS